MWFFSLQVESSAFFWKTCFWKECLKFLHGKNWDKHSWRKKQGSKGENIRIGLNEDFLSWNSAKLKRHARCLKITKKSHLTSKVLFWVDKSQLKMPKMVYFVQFFAILITFWILVHFLNFGPYFWFWSNFGISSIFGFWSTLASFWKQEVRGQTLLPEF